jgi:hypothetical protein
MVELWFYSGRIGNCMFAYAFNRCLAYSLKTRCSLPKGTEIAAFPNIARDAEKIDHHEHKHQIYLDYPENPRTVENENDNMSWHIEKQFQGGKIESFGDNLTIQKILSIPNIDKKWLVTLGNFETGNQYLPYRGQLKEWFRFPNIDYSKFEFFKLAPNREDYFTSSEKPEIDKDDLVISLRLEDYTTDNNKDRLLDFDYFKIILESKRFNKLVIITNPGCINHQEFYYKFFDAFREYDPIVVRCYEPVMSMAYGALFNNIAISQSTYSWWLAFLSEAENIYYPIPLEGPFSFNDERYFGTDLRVSSPDFKFVDYETRQVLPDDYYTKIDYDNRTWKD